MSESRKLTIGYVRIRIAVLAVLALAVSFVLGRWSGGARRNELDAFLANRTKVLTVLQQTCASPPMGIEFVGGKPGLGTIFHPGDAFIRKVAPRLGWQMRGTYHFPVRLTEEFIADDGKTPSKITASHRLLRAFFAPFDRLGFQRSSGGNEGGGASNTAYQWWGTADGSISVLGMVMVDQATHSGTILCFKVEHY